MQLITVCLAAGTCCSEQDSMRINDLLATIDCRYELPDAETSIEWPLNESCLQEPACECCCEPEPLREGEIQFIVSLPAAVGKSPALHPAERWVQRFHICLVGLWLVVVIGEFLFWRTARHVGFRPSHVGNLSMEFPRITSSFPLDRPGDHSF